MRYRSNWMSLTEMIAHIGAIQHCNQSEATEDARKVLYDGEVESRKRGSDPSDRIEPNSWARAIFFKDGSVSFSRHQAGVPAPGWEPLRLWIEVNREDVERKWPSGSTTTYTTGAPGRPTSRHLVEPEAKRRIAAGDVPERLAEFAKSLSGWLSGKHPTATPMTGKTIENLIRPLWHNRPSK